MRKFHELLVCPRNIHSSLPPLQYERMKRSIALIYAAISIIMTSNSSSPWATEQPKWTYVEFLDQTETFQTPPPTQVALGELLAESDFVAVVYSVASFDIQDCEAEVLRVKKMCALREGWTAPGRQLPHLLRNPIGDDFLLAVGRRKAEIFTHGEGFDHDAYDKPMIRSEAPYLYFGKVRPVTTEQALELQSKGPTSILDGGEMMPLGFNNITPKTPVRAVQGLRGVYPLLSLNKMTDVENASISPATEFLQSYHFKYLIQTYGQADASPLVQGVNRLLAALAQEKPQATQALEALIEDANSVTAAAAEFLLEQEKLPRFQFNHPVPLPLKD